MGSFKELIVYKKAFDLAMSIFAITKGFPVDEKYGLTSQIRRSSRSVCSNIAEGYRKRLYPAHFVAKASDADMENAETSVWLDFALGCGYIDEHCHREFISANEEIGRLLAHMVNNPGKYRGSR
ncbi:four helix bundle protein [Taibaiella koreensis]|uniref:four helix bundle protein n=1 Tax=Taibaiella koreensis TaxID=1268548 RepID=UPI000E59BC10|nr:four helix bundle protein [Taibaiella koreensis]